MEEINQFVYNESNLQEALGAYYSTLFPCNLMYRWLGYGDPFYFHKREISFMLPKDKYLRYRAFKSEDDFRSYLLKQIPMKIDIGAVYDKIPCDNIYFSSLKPIERELVFDIDMTDYDAIRTCCKEAKICNRCWKFLSIACKIIDMLLRDDFRFKHILWVFSGRRGVHCWVCDKDARNLSDQERISLLSYINIIKGGTYRQKRVELLEKPSYSIQRALDIINKDFVDFIIVNQNILGTDNGLKVFEELLWDSHRDEFVKAMSEKQTSLERWNAFESHLNFLLVNKLIPDKLKYLKEELMLHFAYPRLDAAVTRKRDHLLKAPFCVHPKTGNICVPFDPNAVEQFDVNQVPKIDQVLQELNDHYKQMGVIAEINTGKIVLVNILKTGLSRSVDVFLEFLRGIENANSNKLTRRIV